VKGSAGVVANTSVGECLRSRMRFLREAVVGEGCLGPDSLTMTGSRSMRLRRVPTEE
jgi:hypothetical protein